MSTLTLLFTSSICKNALWPAGKSSNRTIAPLIPSPTLQEVLGGVADYAAASKTVSQTGTIVGESGWLQKMQEATTIEDYQTAAKNLDVIQGHNKWKDERDFSEPEYNPQIIESQMRAMEHARSTSDLSAMQHLIRTNLSRDLGGMNLPSLYKHSWIGTKFLIEDYIQSVLDTIKQFTDAAIGFKIATPEVHFYQQSLTDSLKYFGRSALLLSGGAIFGLKHVGVVKTLWEADLLPDIISGASAGSIVAAITGVSNDEELKEKLRILPTSNLACFDPAGTTTFGWLRERVKTFVNTKTFFAMNEMEKVLQEWVGDLTFQEANYKTRRVLNICVSSSASGEPRLLNHVTAPDVLIWSAVCASCSVPAVFPSTNIYERDPITKEVKIWMQHATQLFVDGSLDHDIPTRKLSEMFNVNFFIVSQVNPHVRMFLDSEEEFVGQAIPSLGQARWDAQGVMQFTKHFIRRELVHRGQQAINLGIPEGYMRWASLFSQQYTGDINILPDLQWDEYTYMMANPTANFMKRAVKDGERATWCKMHRIKNCVAVELALIRAIHTLRERVYFGQEARAAREVTSHDGKQRTYSIQGQRPSFQRRQSLITNDQNGSISTQPSTPATPGAIADVRRRSSLSALSGRLSISALTNSLRRISGTTNQNEGDPGRLRDLLKLRSYFILNEDEAIDD